jgi:hypothetical protein
VAKEDTQTRPDQQPDLAEAVRRLSEGMQRLLKSGLTRRAVVILLKHETGVPMGQIEAVLDGLGDLARQYTTK